MCNRCKINRRTTKHAWCTQCRKEYDAELYKKTKSRRLELNKEYRVVNRDWLRSIKSNTPCMDCGQKFHFAAMQFDHRPNEIKLFDLSGAFDMSQEKILAEMAKCDIVCANCHAVRTYNRRESVV